MARIHPNAQVGRRRFHKTIIELSPFLSRFVTQLSRTAAITPS